MPLSRHKDGIEITTRTVVNDSLSFFSHGWPLSADDRDNQMLFFLHHGYRAVTVGA